MKAPVVSGKEMMKYLSSKGFEIVGRKGSHVRLKKLAAPRNLVVIVPDPKNWHKARYVPYFVKQELALMNS